MANSVLSSVVVLLLLCLVTGAYARPCKTLFYISASRATALHPSNSQFFVRNQGPRYLTLIFSSRTNRFPDGSSMENPSDLPLKVYSSISRSIRDRSGDIISVVRVLLFGVGCGALAAAILYFLWALISPRTWFDLGDVSSSSDGDDDDGDLTAYKKKIGYVIIPTHPKAVDDDLKKPPPVSQTV